MQELVGAKADFIQLSADYSDIFDSVYEANARGEKFEREVVPANLDRAEEGSGQSEAAEKRASSNRKRAKEINRARMAKHSRRRNRKHR
jgi:hypothetical protein